MQGDYSWGRSAREYAGLYSLITGVSLQPQEKQASVQKAAEVPVKPVIAEPAKAVPAKAKPAKEKPVEAVQSSKHTASSKKDKDDKKAK